MLYGYARVSTIDQDLSVQNAPLTAAGCGIIREEKVSGTSTEGREKLKILLQFLRQGGTPVVVIRIDRLAQHARPSNLRRECQMEGIPRAKPNGIYVGKA
jgi:DNA invertase Pin-like site-specific DNA recombinase